MKLSELTTTRDVEIKFPTGSSLTVTYDANKLTPKIEAELNEATNAQQMASLVGLLVTKWDLEEDGGTGTVPITPERLMELPLIVLGIVIRGVTRDIAESTRAEGNS